MSSPVLGPQDVLSALTGEGGWDQFGQMMGGRKVNDAAADNIAECASAVLASEAGQVLFQYLIDEFLLTAKWPGDLMGADQLATYGAFREGQNSIVMLLHQLARRGAGLSDGGENP